MDKLLEKLINPEQVKEQKEPTIFEKLEKKKEPQMTAEEILNQYYASKKEITEPCESTSLKNLLVS